MILREHSVWIRIHNMIHGATLGRAPMFRSPVLDNFRKEIYYRAKKASFFGGIQQPHSGESPPPTSMVRHLGWRFDEGITLTVWITTFFCHISRGKRALQLLHSCMALSIIHDVNILVNMYHVRYNVEYACCLWVHHMSILDHCIQNALNFLVQFPISGI